MGIIKRKEIAEFDLDNGYSINKVELAKDYVDTHPDMKAPLIVVNSWNEWTEGSYFEPDDVNGYGCLEVVKKLFVDRK